MSPCADLGVSFFMNTCKAVGQGSYRYAEKEVTEKLIDLLIFYNEEVKKGDNSERESLRKQQDCNY